MRLVLALLCLLAGCTTANVGSQARENQTQRRTFNAPPEEAYVAAVQVAADYGWKITSSDPAARVFAAEAPGALSRWPDEVSVIVAPHGDPPGSQVTVRSGLGQGPNHRHVQAYLDELGTALGTPAVDSGGS